jgi:hypothetical protein
MREGEHMEHPDTGGRIILKWMLKKLYGAWTGSGSE